MAQKKDAVKKGRSYFTLVGHAKVNDYTFTMDKESGKSSYIYSRMNLGVDCGTGNVVYAEMMGGFRPDGSSKVYVHGKDANGRDDFNNRIVLDWDERNNPDIMKEIGDQNFIRVGLEKDIKGNTVVNRFLSPYDAIAYIQENLESNTYISVSGSIEYSVYEGETQVRKRINSVFLAKEDASNPPKAKFTQSFLLNKDFLGKVDKEKNSITATGYVVEYVNKLDDVDVKKNLLMKKTFEFDLNKIPEENVKKFVQAFLKFKAGYLLELVVDGEFREGVSTVATTYDDLDNDSKTLVALGMLTVEEALAQRAVTGSREKRMIFNKPHQIESVTKGNDGSEVVTKSVAIIPDKYVEDDVEYYGDYAEEPMVLEETSDGMLLDDDSMDFLNSLT
jgi:hypothetical protein